MELEIHVEGTQIIVNRRDTRLTITYTKLSDAPCIIEDPSWTRDEGLEEFRVRAWQVAHDEKLVGSLDCRLPKHFT
jgi:hypothetical protein